MENNQVDIVVVEDDPNDAELIIRVLKKHNLANKLVHLKDGEEALDYFMLQGSYANREDKNPKVILLDLKLPKVNGIEVLKTIRSDDRTKTIPVVILTSSKEDRDLIAAYKGGANSYVAKPIKFEEFAKVVSDLGLYWSLINRSP